MKFGKLLQRSVEVSFPEWRDQWMDYKALKKQLKGMHGAGERAAGAGLSMAEALGRDAGEVKFFSMLRDELAKVSRHYAVSEKEAAERYQSLMQMFERLQAAPVKTDEDVGTVLTRLVRFYMDLILLENFAVMCYCGFGKILKKHDKVTGFDTRRKYIINMVNPQNFTHYPQLLKMLHYTEAAYLAVLQWLPMQRRHLLQEDAAKLEALTSMKERSQEAKTGLESGREGGGVEGEAVSSMPLATERSVGADRTPPSPTEEEAPMASTYDSDMAGSGAGAGAGAAVGPDTRKDMYGRSASMAGESYGGGARTGSWGGHTHAMAPPAPPAVTASRPGPGFGAGVGAGTYGAGYGDSHSGPMRTTAGAGMGFGAHTNAYGGGGVHYGAPDGYGGARAPVTSGRRFGPAGHFGGGARMGGYAATGADSGAGFGAGAGAGAGSRMPATMRSGPDTPGSELTERELAVAHSMTARSDTRP